MPIKNNDDVAHLLDAMGRTGSTYREFETSSDQMSAPLIDAIFGKEPPLPVREDAPLALGATSGNDLLADVFDRSPALAQGRPADTGMRHPESPRQSPLAGIRTPVAGPGAAMRTLNDIRRIITQPVEQSAAAPSIGSLNGLFDRLAR
ncbi:hypothetical protein [Reyranella sp.]|uniref:hypothetical protein n=1 Tax=Reyranella sp. TaxID=1929291 RepID=UPI003D1373EF